MIRLLFLICCVLSFLHFQVVYAGQAAYSANLTKKDAQTAIQSGSLGGIRTQSGIIEVSEIEQNSIKIIEVHQEGNAAFVYCNFTHKQGRDFFGYIPLLQLNATMWMNRDNGIIFEK